MRETIKKVPQKMQHNGFKRDTIKMHHISGPAEPVFKDSSANHLHLSHPVQDCEH